MFFLNNLIKKLNSYKEDYWDFKEYRANGVQKICKYPAMMVSPMQYQLIKDIVKIEGDIKNILDPFHGSGTVLVEGKKLGLEVYGIDINPLANLITNVKLNGVNKYEVKNSIQNIRNKLLSDKFKYKIHYFHKIDKWFKSDIIKSLSKIREAIIEEKNLLVRRYFWVCFADVVLKQSNTRSSTYKLHIKTDEDIAKIINNTFELFLNKIENYYLEILSNDYADSKLYLGDSIKILNQMNSNSFDLICTSPPYGDNHTTVTYGQFSMLPLYWIDQDDCDKFDKNLLLNYSSIDKYSLGGMKTTATESASKVLNNLLFKIAPKKRNKLVSFINDYDLILYELSRIIKPNKLLVLTIGNRTVDRIEIPFDEINIELAQKYGFMLETKLERNIFNKVMPRKLSNVNNKGSVKAMNKEKILLFRKR